MSEDRDETRQQRSDGAEAPASPMWRPVSRANTYELVIDAVEEQIMAGSLTVGVSRASVREALRVLDSLGVVRSAGGSGRGAGTFIAAMPSAALTRFLRLHVALANFSISDVLDTRVQLERSSAVLAAARADEDAVAAINAQLAMMDTPGVSLEVFNDADTAFHVAIAQAAGNQLFSDLTAAIRTSLRGSIFAAFNRVDDQQALMSRLQAQHREITAAIVAGRGEDAAQLTEEHIRFAAAQLPGLSEA